jgi:dephospho-CoA kinase
MLSCVLPFVIKARLIFFVFHANSSAEIQLQRLMKRDGSSREEASARLNSQLPISDKMDYADMIIENSGSIQELEQEVATFVKKLRKEIGGLRWLVSWLIPPLGLASAGITIMCRRLAKSKRGSKSS